MKINFRIFLALSLLMIINMDALSQNSLKVMSFNIRQCMVNDGPNNWKLRKEATPAMLEDIMPDILGVQEAYLTQVKYIKQECPVYRSVGRGRNDGRRCGEHTAIFFNKSKFKLLDNGMFWLSQTPDVPSIGWDAKYSRTATWAKLRCISSGEEFIVINTHLDNVGLAARTNGLKMICDWVDNYNSDGLPVVLLGDFNIRPEDSSLEYLNTQMLCAREHAGISDQSGSYTGYGNRNEVCIIDYIYYRGFSACHEFKVNNKEYAGKKYISDHYPIYAIFEF